MASIILRKDLPASKLLQDWYLSLKPSEQTFVASKLKALIYLDGVQLDWALLQNLLLRWHPDTYTFHFGSLELAPTYEEYLQLSELPHRPGILPLPVRGSPRDDLPSVLRICGAATHHLLTPQNNIDIQALLSLQMATYCPTMGDGQMSARAFILMFAGSILLPFTAGSLHGRAIYLAKAILEDRPFLPNILGETYFGITRIFNKVQHGVQNHRVSFCLHLLQAWFFTHLGVTGYSLYRGAGLLRRIAAHAFLPTKTFAGTQELFDELTTDDLCPMARCFQFGPIFVASTDGPYIPLMGITGTSYYIPIRVAHQFGGVPEIPPPPRVLHAPIEVDTEEAAQTRTRRAISIISHAWFLPITRTFQPPYVVPEIADAATRRHWIRRNSRWDR